MRRRILRVAMVGAAAVLLGTPAAADHVRVGSGFLAESVVEWHGPRIHFRDARGPVDFRAGTDIRPTDRSGPKGPRGRGNGHGPGGKRGDKGTPGETGFFGEGPTVVLPDVTPPSNTAGGFVGDVSSGPTAATPEPATLLLLGAGLGGALLHRARRRRDGQGSELQGQG